MMQVTDLAIPAVKKISVRRFGDARGWFCETYNQQRFADAGITNNFVQDNQSMSVEAGTLRGLHLQIPPFAQAKLVRVLSGRILDVAVDIRHGSPTFGKHVTIELDAAGGDMVLVPAGFAHAFLTLEPHTSVAYKVDAFYSPQCERGIIWNDPTLAIDWGIDPAKVLLSDRDKKHPPFSAVEPWFTFAQDRRS
jgi:dTDP-4-dehydrorhamnose 3,5-epimerase